MNVLFIVKNHDERLTPVSPLAGKISASGHTTIIPNFCLKSVDDFFE